MARRHGGRVGSFSEIADREGKVERHIRLLVPLVFVSPRIISAIMDGSVPAGPTVTGLAQPLAYSWIEQERRIRSLTHKSNQPSISSFATTILALSSPFAW